MSEDTSCSEDTLDLGKEIESTERVPQDLIFDLLSYDHRREVLDLLLTHERALTVTDLRNEIVKKEHDREITEIPNEKIKQIHAALYHVHLPKLDEAGVIDFDPDRNRVKPTEKLSRLEPVLVQLLQGQSD